MASIGAGLLPGKFFFGKRPDLVCFGEELQQWRSLGWGRKPCSAAWSWKITTVRDSFSSLWEMPHQPPDTRQRRLCLRAEGALAPSRGSPGAMCHGDSDKIPLACSPWISPLARTPALERTLVAKWGRLRASQRPAHCGRVGWPVTEGSGACVSRAGGEAGLSTACCWACRTLRSGRNLGEM